MADRFSIRHGRGGTPYIRVTMQDGRRVQKSFPGKTDEEAREAARKWLECETARATGPEGVSLSTALARYLEHIEPNKAPNTGRTYRMFATSYARPLAGRTLEEITTADVADLLTQLQTKGAGHGPLSGRTVAAFRSFLSGAFRWFCKMGMCAANPVAATDKPHVLHKEAGALDDQSLTRLIQTLRDVLDGDEPTNRAQLAKRNYALAAWIATNTGARVGEVCALRRRDVWPQNSQLHICGNVSEGGAGATRRPETKGHRNRSVTVDGETMRLITQHMRHVDAILAATGPDTPILTTDGRPLHPNTVSKAVGAIMRGCGIQGMHFHSLRHTHGTQLMRSGLHVITIQERLGHSKPHITVDVYGHSAPGFDARAADVMASITSTCTEGVDEGGTNWHDGHAGDMEGRTKQQVSTGKEAV